MTVRPSKSRNSDVEDSDPDDMVSLLTEQEIYRRKYQLLLERCEVLQQDNERLQNRISEVRKLTKRYRKDVVLLVERLQDHGDDFQKAAERARRTLTRPERPPPPAQAAGAGDAPPAPLKKPQKRKPKAEKAEKDPNAPKKPCNAFFQFCQEQRPLVIAETNSEGNEPSKTEITRQLAARWRALSIEDKKVKLSPHIQKVYVEMFERSKEKYAEEMSAYVSVKKEKEQKYEPPPSAAPGVPPPPNL